MLSGAFRFLLVAGVASGLLLMQPERAERDNRQLIAAARAQIGVTMIYDGSYLLIHNIGAGVQEEAIVGGFPRRGHYRYRPWQTNESKQGN